MMIKPPIGAFAPGLVRPEWEWVFQSDLRAAVPYWHDAYDLVQGVRSGNTAEGEWQHGRLGLGYRSNAQNENPRFIHPAYRLDEDGQGFAFFRAWEILSHTGFQGLGGVRTNSGEGYFALYYGQSTGDLFMQYDSSSGVAQNESLGSGVFFPVIGPNTFSIRHKAGQITVVLNGRVVVETTLANTIGGEGAGTEDLMANNNDADGGASAMADAIDQALLYWRGSVPSVSNLVSLARDPFGPFRSSRRLISLVEVVPEEEAPVGDTLVVADLASASALDSLALTQAHVLTVNDLLSAAALDEPALAQANVLAADALASTSAIDAPALTQANVLVVTALDSASVLDGVALTQANVLVAQSLLIAAALDAFALTQAHNLEVQDLLASVALDAPALTQANVLAALGVSSASTLDSPTLTGTDSLSVSGLASAASLDAVALTQANVLAVLGLDVASTLDAVALTQAHQLAVQALAVAATIDSPTLSLASLLATADMLVATSLDSPALTQAHLLTIAGLLSGSSFDSPALVQANVLAVNDLLSAVALANVVLPGAPLGLTGPFTARWAAIARTARFIDPARTARWVQE